jgi:hypothetical protein
MYILTWKMSNLDRKAEGKREGRVWRRKCTNVATTQTVAVDSPDKQVVGSESHAGLVGREIRSAV